jgi:hypothetical protein
MPPKAKKLPRHDGPPTRGSLSNGELLELLSPLSQQQQPNNKRKGLSQQQQPNNKRKGSQPTKAPKTKMGRVQVSDATATAPDTIPTVPPIATETITAFPTASENLPLNEVIKSETVESGNPIESGEKVKEKDKRLQLFIELLTSWLEEDNNNKFNSSGVDGVAQYFDRVLLPFLTSGKVDSCYGNLGSQVPAWIIAYPRTLSLLGFTNVSKPNPWSLLEGESPLEKLRTVLSTEVDCVENGKILLKDKHPQFKCDAKLSPKNPIELVEDDDHNVYWGAWKA